MVIQKRYFELSDKNSLSESVQFIEKTLKEAGLDIKLVIKAVLTSEESIAQLMEHANSEGKLCVQIRKKFGDAEVVISAPGSEYDPYEATPDNSEYLEGLEDADAQNVIRAILLKAQGENYKFSYKKGVNRVRIMTGGTEKSMLKSTMIALALGVIFGLMLQMVVPSGISAGIITYALDPVKTIFMNSLKIIIAPVVFFSIVSCISQFKDISQLGRIGTRVMGMYMLTTVLAVLLAMGVFMLIKPGSFGFALSMTENVQEISVSTDVDTSLLNTIVGIVPSNFVKPFLESDTLQIIFLAFLCGSAVGMLGEYSEVLKNFFEACNSLFLTITTMITKMIPFAVFCSVAIMVKEMGGASLFDVLGYFGTILLAVTCMIVLYAAIILIGGHLNPITFFRKNREGMLTSFTLASSSAAMPTNMRTCTDKMGISPRVCSFSIPLGATVNMDGTCMFLVISGLFLARAYGVEVMPSSYLSLAITIILLSLGAPGVPGAGIVCLGIVLSQIGVPLEAIGLIIGIHPIIDMFETMSNTTGDVTAALVVAKREGLLDMDVYKS